MKAKFEVTISDDFFNKNMSTQTVTVADQLCETIRRYIARMPVTCVTSVEFLEHDFSSSKRPHIEVDNFGVLPIVGGVKFDSKKIGHKEMIIAEDAGTNLLFEISGNTARYYGTFCGTEQERFNVTHDGRRFTYKYVTYVKMTLDEIKSLVKKHRYEYNVADSLDWR